MKLNKLFYFFINEIKFQTWIKVFINFIIQSIVILSELLFLSTFFLILNQSINSNLLNVFVENLNKYIVPFFTSFSQVEFYILVLIFFLVLKNIMIIFQNIYYQKFMFKLTAEKSAQVLQSYMDKSFDLFSKVEISIYIKQLVKDVENVFIGIFGLTVSFIGEIIYAGFLIYFVSHLIDFTPTIEVFVLLGLISLIIYLLFLLAKKFGEVRAANEIKVFKTLSDTLNIFKEIKLIEGAHHFVSRYQNFLIKYYKSRIGSSIINISPKFMFELFVLMLFFVIYKSESSDLSITDFIIKYSTFAVAMLRLIPSFARLSSYSSMMLYNLNSIKFIKNDLNKRTSQINKRILVKRRLNSVKLSGVHLNYINKDNSKISPKLNNLKLSLKKNHIYGIYGESGSGKTSLLNMLSGFIKPNKGQVFINEKVHNFYDLTKKFKIGYAPQTPTILDENIIMNTTLEYSNSNEKITRLKEYLKIFNLKKFINKKYFENNYISSIKSMSGGEKQRIGFIRAIINNPDLILLDEPTSSLDKKNEKKIFKFLLSIKKNKIIVVTSHKEDQKKYFDEIINL